MQSNKIVPPNSGFSESFAAALQFDAADLQENQAGMLSRAQAQRLRQSFQKTMLLVGGGLLIITLVALRPMEWVSAGGPPDDRVFVAIGLLAILWLVTLPIGVVGLLRFRRDVGDGRVAVVRGPVQLSTHKRNYSPNSRTVYTVQIDDNHFRVPAALYVQLQHGGTYTFFFTPHSKKVVSVM